ncbi:MAG: type II secretion system F family protein [Planctomycetota bacterium]|jgi:type IV pilus assembly protein PilC
MATFEYNALTQAGRAMKGTIEAGDPEEAHQLLEQMQLTINSIEKAKAKKPKKPIGRSEFMLFNQQLASITKAGIPLERGLRELSRDVASNKMRKLIESIADDLEAGVSIEQAFEKRQKHFPPLYGKILKAGVETGRLSDMLTSLNRHIDMTNRTRRIVFEALAYPAVIFTLTILIISLVCMVVVPQIRYVMTDLISGGQVNLITKGFFFFAEHIMIFWLALIFLIAAIALFFTGLSSSKSGRKIRELIMMKMPVFGRLYHSGILSKMSEAMAMMVAAGTEMPACLRLSSEASGSETLADESEMVAQQIEKGNNILEAGQFCNIMPGLFFYSIQLGAQRNELQDNLYSLSQMYNEQTLSGQARLQALLLPVMLILVGGFIGFSVISIYMPVIQVITGLSTGGM